MPFHYAELALSVARCPEVAKAGANPLHPCHKVVHFQDRLDGPFQVPEAWASNLETARVGFLSSNPSISGADPEAKTAHRRFAELYPTEERDKDLLADFMTRRFSSRNQRVDGNLQHLKWTS